MNEKEKMLAGQLYNPADEELTQMRFEARCLTEQYNRSSIANPEERKELLKKIFPLAQEGLYMEPTINVDYGCNTRMGVDCYFNYNSVILDVCPVTIGDNLMAGCGVQIVTPIHPMVASERIVQDYPDGRHDLEYAKPIWIGSNVWLASGVIVCGGAHIGDNCVIGAGAVVMGDIPANSFAAGVPAKVIRPITDADKWMK